MAAPSQNDLVFFRDSMTRYRQLADGAAKLLRTLLDFSLFRYFQGIFNFHAKITNRAFQLGMT